MIEARINYNTKLAVLIRAMRSAAGLNQGELSVAANCSRPTVNRIEAINKVSPTANTIDDLFHVFRQMGAEIYLNDEDVSVKFTKEFLLGIQDRVIKGGQK